MLTLNALNVWKKWNITPRDILDCVFAMETNKIVNPIRNWMIPYMDFVFEFLDDNLTRWIIHTAQKMKFPIKDFFSKWTQIHRKAHIWSHLLKKILNWQLHFLCRVSNPSFFYRSEDIWYDFPKTFKT